MQRKLEWNKLVPFLAAIVFFLVFTLLTGGNMVSAFNLSTLVDQALLLVVGCCGTIFVASQGSVDLSVGVNTAMAGVLGAMAYDVTGSFPLMLLVIVAVGVAIGLFNSLMIGVCKVPSFMATLALLIGMRGIVNYIQSVWGLSYAPMALVSMNASGMKFVVLVIIVVVMGYVFECTRYGRYCKAIGENETVARYSGVPVLRMKVLAYLLSGLTAALASVFLIARLGGTSTTMGSFFEIKVMMSIYVGGVLVSGGTGSRLYKAIVGAFIVIIIENGLMLLGYSSSQVSESVQGILLVLILVLMSYIDRREQRVRA